MRLSDAQIQRLSGLLLDALLNSRQAVLKVERSRVLAPMEEVIRDNLAEEQALEREARRLLEIHLQQAPPGLDEQKVLAMIKRKLADERGFPL